MNVLLRYTATQLLPFTDHIEYGIFAIFRSFSTYRVQVFSEDHNEDFKTQQTWDYNLHRRPSIRRAVSTKQSRMTQCPKCAPSNICKRNQFIKEFQSKE